MFVCRQTEIIFTGAWCLFNYAFLQVLVNNNANMAKQLYYQKLQSKDIQNLFVQVFVIMMLMM